MNKGNQIYIPQNLLKSAGTVLLLALILGGTTWLLWSVEPRGSKYFLWLASKYLFPPAGLYVFTIAFTRLIFDVPVFHCDDRGVYKYNFFGRAKLYSWNDIEDLCLKSQGAHELLHITLLDPPNSVFQPLLGEPGVHVVQFNLPMTVEELRSKILATIPAAGHLNKAAAFSRRFA